MIHRPILLASLLLAFPALSHCAPGDAPRRKSAIISSDLSGKDIQFFKDAAGNLDFTIQLSQSAGTRASTPEIKSLAAAIATEQSAAAKDLQDLAARKGIPAAHDSRPSKSLKSLLLLKGLRFDKAYLDSLSESLSRLRDSFAAGANSSDGDIRQAAAAGTAMVERERAQLHRLGI